MSGFEEPPEIIDAPPQMDQMFSPAKKRPSIRLSRKNTSLLPQKMPSLK